MLQANPYAVPAPPPGSVGVGELLADANTRRLWLGVPAATNPAQALLVADIVALQTEDADIRADFTEMLNTGLQGKAPLAHTHTASQITDFNAAVGAAVGPGSGVPTGCVLTYAGQLSAIGQGPLAGYILCDGRSFDQATFPALYQVLGKATVPDLRDRFAYGAGNQQPGFIGGAKDLSFNTAAAGLHSHNALTGYTAITVAQMPSHAHSVYDPQHIHPASQASHNHDYRRPEYSSNLIGNGVSLTYSYGKTDNANTSSVAPAISVGYAATGIGIYAEGGSQGHAHAIGNDGNHTHAVNITGGNLPPFVALAYIIKT